MNKNGSKPQRTFQKVNYERKWSGKVQQNKQGRRSRSQSRSGVNRQDNNGRNRSQSRSSSKSRNNSQFRSYGYVKKIHVPSFGSNQLGVHSLSAQTFDVIITQRNNNPNQYSCIEYLLMALYFSVYARYDGRTLQNKNVRDKIGKTQNLDEIISGAMVSILDSFPKGIRETEDEMSHRLHDLFGLFYEFVSSHGYDTSGSVIKFGNIRVKNEWFRTFNSRSNKSTDPEKRDRVGSSKNEDEQPKI